MATLGHPEPGFIEEVFPYAVVMTQDCDLESDYRIRAAAGDHNKGLPEVLFCQLPTADQIFMGLGKNQKLWDRIHRNNDPRYHFFQAVEPAYDAYQEDLPELVADFKRYFTIPTTEVYRRIELGLARRRCVLVSPYLEHLSHRYAYFLSRVGLPEDHQSV